MGFRVAGVLDGALYEVEVTGDAAKPVVGSKRVRALVTQFTGETVLATPVGPSYIVRADDASSVLALLVSQTKIRWVGEGAPKLVEPRPAGHVW